MVLVSHDVAFVRAVAEGIIAVAPGGGGVRRFAGGYDYYRSKIDQEASGRSDEPEAEKSVDAAKLARTEALRDRKVIKNELRRVERDVAALEQEIAALETEQFNLHGQLAAVDTPEDVRAVAGRRLREVEDVLAVREVAWEAAGKRRDELAAKI